MKKRIAWLLACLMTVMLALAGCGEKVTAEDVLNKSVENAGSKKSVEMDLKLIFKGKVSVEQSGTQVGLDMDMNMAGTIQSLTETGDSHGTIDLGVSMMGADISTNMEFYSVEEDGERVAYTKQEDAWSRTAGDQDSGSMDMDFGSIQEMVESGEASAELQENTEEVDGKEAYVVKMNISEDSLKEVTDSLASAMGGSGEGETELSLPVTYYVEKETMLPLKMAIDMKALGNAMMGAQEGASVELSDFSMEVTFSGFDTVNEIVVPEDVKSAAGESGDSGLDDILNELESEAEEESAEPAGEETTGAEEEEGPVTDADGNYVLTGYSGEGQALLGDIEGYEITYGSENMIAFSNDEIDITFSLDDYTPDEEMVESYGFADYMQGDEDYSNIQVSEIQTMTAGDREIQYFSEDYLFMEENACRDYYAWTEIEDGIKLVCEIEYFGYDAETPDLDTSIIETAFSAVK